MISGSPQAHQPSAVWPFIVMPAIVLIVFCVLHYDVRSMGNHPAKVAPPTALSSDTGIPTE